MTPELLSRRSVLAGGLGVVVSVAVGCADDESSGAPGTSPATSLPASTSPAGTSPAGTSPPVTVAGDDGYVPPADGAGDWATVEPAAAGFTDDGVAALVDLVGARNSQSLMLLRHGRIVAERYWMDASPTTVRDIASCQKSVVSTLIGRARHDGLLTLDDTVTDVVGSGWSAARPAQEAAITVGHLLSMTSGLHPNTLRAVAEPGSVWNYNTDAYQKLRRVLEAVSSRQIDELTHEWLLDPIGGSEQWRWWIRPGAPADAVGDEPRGLQLTARDMARFGVLAMRGGVWSGDQIVPVGWLAEAWTPVPVKRDYGYLWWLTGRGGLASTGVPADTVAALGAQDQKIYVSPSAGVVLCRQGNAAGRMSEAESDFDRELLRALVAAVDSAG